MENNFRIASIALDEETLSGISPTMRNEREVAIADFVATNYVMPMGIDHTGPYHAHLTLADQRLMIELFPEQESLLLARIALPLKPLRTIIKDYFLICESYVRAIETANPSKIEAIDMGRRGLHNEGSEALRELLAQKVTLDFETARRLFTLICVLHMK